MQNQSNYIQENGADIKNIATSMNTATLEDYGTDTATCITKEKDHFDSISVDQAEYHSMHEDRTNFSRVEHDNAIEAYEAYEYERDENSNAIEAYEAYENERNKDDVTEAYEDGRNKSDSAIESYEAYENEKDEDDNDYYANIRYTKSSEPSLANSNHELKAEDPVNYDSDDETNVYYDHEDFYSKGA